MNTKIIGIQNILRATNVKRWHIVNTMREQNIAEHQWNVTMIARAIAKKAGSDISAVTEYALTHDLHEVVDGDLPSPTKEWLSSQGIVFNSDTDTEWETIFIVKLADILEMIWFLADHGIGRHAEMVLSKLSDKIDAVMEQAESPDRIGDAFWSVNKELFEGEMQGE